MQGVKATATVDKGTDSFCFQSICFLLSYTIFIKKIKFCDRERKIEREVFADSVVP